MVFVFFISRGSSNLPAGYCLVEQSLCALASNKKMRPLLQEWHV
jgi:hypothetical protein